VQAGRGRSCEGPRPESSLGDPARDPLNATTPDFIPIGLFNRFDLTPKDGSSCGESTPCLLRLRLRAVLGATLVDAHGYFTSAPSVAWHRSRPFCSVSRSASALPS